MADEVRLIDPDAPQPKRLSARDVHDAIRRIVEAWNQAIPRGKVRLVSMVRWRDLAELLRLVGLDEILATIAWYGSSEWNRQRGAWLSFDRFIGIGEFTRKMEMACESRLRRERASRRPPPQQAAPASAGPDRRQLQQQFDALPPERRQGLLDQARSQLSPFLARWPAQVQLRALHILSAEDSR
jgi:hypothetical protein